MDNSFDHLNEEERVRAENEFLKMKLMLEQGAQFFGSGNSENSDLPPEIENEFLNYIIAFEREFEKGKTIKLFDKIGCPTHFISPADIPDENMEQAWEELSMYLSEKGIGLSACSPNVSTRELYRFAIEELFKLEIDDFNIPGMTTNFIYDEFYPDHIYDNSRLVQENVVRDIFTTDNTLDEIHYLKEGFTVNGKEYRHTHEFEEAVHRFQLLFDAMELEECTVTECRMEDPACFVGGSYKAIATLDDNETLISGNFKILLETPDGEYWYVKDMDIEGLTI